MQIVEPQPFNGQPVQIGRGDFAAECADVREPEIVGHDQQDVRGRCIVRRAAWHLRTRSLFLRRARLQNNQSEGAQGAFVFHVLHSA